MYHDKNHPEGSASALDMLWQPTPQWHVKTENWDIDFFQDWPGYIFVGLKLVVCFETETVVKKCWRCDIRKRTT